MPSTKTMNHFLFFLITPLIFSACSVREPVQVQEEEDYNIKTIIVLPSDTITPDDEGFSGAGKSLQKGALLLDEIITAHLAPNEGIRFISPERQNSLLTEYNQNKSTQTLSIGKKLDADAVLTTRVNRFMERTGQDYSIDNPASISFEYKLVLVQSGQSLCAGVFDETQKSISENILSFRKAFARGGKWITTRELAQEGVEEKFGECRFFNK